LNIEHGRAGGPFACRINTGNNVDALLSAEGKNRKVVEPKCDFDF
jgi:hypothetical protein